MAIPTLRLGRSDIWITELAFGGLPLQRLSDPAEAERVVRYAVERGINFIDTARGYSVSEGFIARALVGLRERVVLASKTPARAAAGVRADLETSLRTLGVETIDLYQFHGVNDDAAYEQVTGPGGGLEVLERARRDGLVREIGLTSHSPEISLRAAESGLFASVMYPFNFIMTVAAEEILPRCRQTQTTFIAMKPMGGGVFQRADVALGYYRGFRDVIKLVGMEQTWEVDEAVQIAEAGYPLPPDAEAEMARLRDLLGTRFCRRCGYCQPCPQGIPISTVLVFEAVWARLPADRALAMSRDGMEKARACIACGECVERCPYKLPIPDLLRETLALYERRLAEVG